MNLLKRCLLCKIPHFCILALTMEFPGQMAQKLVWVTVSWCLFGSFGPKGAKFVWKCKNRHQTHFWSQNVHFAQKDWLMNFFAFWVILASETSIWAYYSKVSCEMAGTCFFWRNALASSILRNIKRCQNATLQYFHFLQQYLKIHLRILEYSPGLARVQRGPRGPGSILKQTVQFLRFGEKSWLFAEIN